MGRALVGVAILLGVAAVWVATERQRESRHVIDLALPAGSYLTGAVGRGLLKYVVRCALEGDTEARLELPGETYRFQGGVGLAPAWAERPLTVAEQRWVSACLYALTNKFGKTVRVDLRGSHPRLATDSRLEIETYPLHEGGFFGNVFLPVPVAYVCEGAGSRAMRDFPVGRLRRCAQPSGKVSPHGQALSECGFVVTGPCSSPSSYVVEGERFGEVVHVWLSHTARGK